MALTLGLPIITVLVPGAYNFEDAASVFGDLSKALSSVYMPASSDRYTTCASSRRSGAVTPRTPLQALSEKLPNGEDIGRVGKLIHERWDRGKPSEYERGDDGATSRKTA